MRSWRKHGVWLFKTLYMRRRIYFNSGINREPLKRCFSFSQNAVGRRLGRMVTWQVQTTPGLTLTSRLHSKPFKLKNNPNSNWKHKIIKIQKYFHMHNTFSVRQPHHAVFSTNLMFSSCVYGIYLLRRVTWSRWASETSAWRLRMCVSLTMWRCMIASAPELEESSEGEKCHSL